MVLGIKGTSVKVVGMNLPGNCVSCPLISDGHCAVLSAIKQEDNVENATNVRSEKCPLYVDSEASNLEMKAELRGILDLCPDVVLK